ncbi:sugar phosphate isomerase/epimerase family protein [Vibrio maritimus]|uniref:sugar phosphate isomerase/epimerase family protein n=1 Tax=Vibrio maritimus TaxID=990268 RepID=UPI001F3EB5A9|nr:sugar phosphate isomerase/epimerase [Vibrio maritimus]
MKNRIACAPCCWGIEESHSPENPSWGKVLMEASDSGYQGIELGPTEYFPEDESLLSSACRTRGLTICAGKLQLPFSDVNALEQILEETEKTCVRLSKLGAKTLLLMEGNHPERNTSVGQSATAPRLNKAQKDALVDVLNKVIAVADKYSLRCLLHPGVGGYISFQDEIDYVLYAIPNSKLGLCIDIGHTFLDGMDPSQVIRRYASRVEHVHLKDVSVDKLRLAIRDKKPWVDAYATGLVTPLGEGDIKLKHVLSTLKQVDYQGWLVVEHEHDKSELTRVVDDLKRSRHYLTAVGV